MIEKHKEKQHIPAATAYPFGGTKQKKWRIIFMGTPAFAVASLHKLIQNGYQVVAVVTAPDKPAGRGLQLQQSEVKQYALQHQIPVLQPVKLKDPAFIEQLKSLQADLQIVVAFRMLPEIVWNMPPLGTINVHGSLLPQYRGAAPINWAIINGEKFTGVTTFKLKHEIDTGDILLSEKINIAENETAGELHDEMKEVGAGLLIKTLKALQDGSLKETPQPISEKEIQELKHAPKIFTEHCEIKWQHATNVIYNLVRGLSPYPTAFTYLQGKKLKIFRVEKIMHNPSVTPGEFDTDGKSYLRFACNDGWISIIELQLEGKKKMGIEDFLRGYRF